MSSLLEKEEEFHKLNAELEKKTKVLMHEVDSVMKLQNTIANETLFIKPTYYDNKFKTRNGPNTGRWENYEENQQTHTIPVLSKCLKTKIILIQKEFDELKVEYKNKCSELKQLHADYNKMEEERNKWQQLSLTYKEQKEKYMNQTQLLNSKLQTKEPELSALKKENENLKKELKIINMNYCSNEQKINKLLEENEKYKNILKIAKQEEREMKEQHKKEINELTMTNKRLERETTELTNGFKKQMLLVDNLKKQKFYLESAKLIQMTEDEFFKILDWKPSD